MIQKLLSELVNHSRNGSGWYFKEIIALEIHTVEYKLLKGFSYFPLFNFLMRKKATIDLTNKDNK